MVNPELHNRRELRARWVLCSRQRRQSCDASATMGKSVKRRKQQSQPARTLLRHLWWCMSMPAARCSSKTPAATAAAMTVADLLVPTQVKAKP